MATIGQSILDRNPVLGIMDSTKFQSYLECPRQFFFEYILGWRGKSNHNDLTFGSAMHEALAHITMNGYTAEAIKEAYTKFLTLYRKEWPSTTDELFPEKNPLQAAKALVAYVAAYGEADIERFTPIIAEASGQVMLPNRRSLHLRMDLVVQDREGRYKVFERKTKKNSFTRVWYDQWQMSFQVSSYVFASMCYFPVESVDLGEIIIDGIAFLKTRIDVERIPVGRSIEQLRNWWFTLQHVWKCLDSDLDVMCRKETEDSPILPCFPQNPTNCTKYFGCRYADLCLAWGNPLLCVDRIPADFTVEFWDPRREDETTTHVDFTLPEAL